MVCEVRSFLSDLLQDWGEDREGWEGKQWKAWPPEGECDHLPSLKTLQRAENLGNWKLRVDAKRSIFGRGTITWQNLWKNKGFRVHSDGRNFPLDRKSAIKKTTPEKWAANRWIPLWIHHSHSSNARRQREREVSYSLIKKKNWYRTFNCCVVRTNQKRLTCNQNF